MKLPPSLRRALADLTAIATRRHMRAAVVGGCVRDAMLGRPTRDLDVLVEGDAGALAELCAKSQGAKVETFGRFGTARLTLSDGARLDLAGARAEHYPESADLPVVRPSTMEDDLARRDFTVNAMAQVLENGGVGRLLDPFRGVDDLRRGMLRVLHPASFRDDPTRLYRAARYAGRLRLRLEPGTAKLFKDSVARKDPARLSRERLRQELMRILEERDPLHAFDLVERWGLAKFLHQRFKVPESLPRADDPVVRLGLIAAGMDRKDGEEFVSSLPLAREDASVILSALKAADEKETPSAPFEPRASTILRLAVPGLPRSALARRFLTGEDLKGTAVVPGPAYSELLDRAAKDQWQGLVTSPADARRWLKRALKKA